VYLKAPSAAIFKISGLSTKQRNNQTTPLSNGAVSDEWYHQCIFQGPFSSKPNS